MQRRMLRIEGTLQRPVGSYVSGTYARIGRVERDVPHFTQTARGGKSRARKARKMSLPDAMVDDSCVLVPS